MLTDLTIESRLTAALALLPSEAAPIATATPRPWLFQESGAALLVRKPSKAEFNALMKVFASRPKSNAAIEKDTVEGASLAFARLCALYPTGKALDDLLAAKPPDLIHELTSQLVQLCGPKKPKGA